MTPTLDAITEELTTLAAYRDILEDIHAQLTERGEIDPYTALRLKILAGGGRMSKESVRAAIEYSNQLDKEWYPTKPISLPLGKLLDHPSIVVSSTIADGRRRIVISGDEEALEVLHRYLVEVA